MYRIFSVVDFAVNVLGIICLVTMLAIFIVIWLRNAKMDRIRKKNAESRRKEAVGRCTCRRAESEYGHAASCEIYRYTASMERVNPTHRKLKRTEVNSDDV